jgi:hypothetical protein
VSVVRQARVAPKLIASVTAAVVVLGLVVVLLVATLMGGLVPQTCGPTAANYAPSAVALADIPGNYLQWIRRDASRYGIDWTVIAGIYSIESDFGRLNAPGVRLGENFAGAGGPGQFLEGTWERYGLDGDGDGLKDRYNPADAIPATANLLRQNGAPTDYRRAVFAYNHASWYVEDAGACGALPRRGAGRPRRCAGSRGRRRRAGLRGRGSGHRAGRSNHGREADVSRDLPRASCVGYGGRAAERAGRCADLR